MENVSCLGELDLPLSPIFVDFIARWLDGSLFDRQHWRNQLSEALSNPHAKMERTVEARLERIAMNEVALAAIERVYAWFRTLATGGESGALKELHQRFDFVSIVGIPRNGGSYLTAELYAALGFDPEAVPAAIAHDGFPEARPFSLTKSNSWINSLMSMSEYLTMIEIFFEKREAKVVIPKKLTKGVYAGRFFNTVFGKSAEYFVTIRHPIACCISTYEKSGGLPENKLFRGRSNIEKWIRRDVAHSSVDHVSWREIGYFEAYVQYWERYHINLAHTGLLTNRKYSIVPYGKQSMEGTAKAIHDRFASTRSVSEFVASPGHQQRHPEWVPRAELAIDRVEAAWKIVGLEFPKEQIADCA